MKKKQSYKDKIEKELKGLKLLLVQNKSIYEQSKKAIDEMNGAIFILEKILKENKK